MGEKILFVTVTNRKSGSHINTQSKVTGHVGAAQLEEAIKDSAIGKKSDR